MTSGPGNGRAAGALDGLRVLDLSSRFGHYCGKLMADMGAEVILVEPPGSGNAQRGEAPFLYGHESDRACGIPFFYFNAGKRSITLDLHAEDGARLFRDLAADADLVLEDGPPGALAARGLGLESLSAANARLCMTSITPFGQTGPYAHHEADDLTLLAQGGLLHMMGYADLPPTQAAGNQAYAMGCMFAAVGSMLALYEAQGSGQGQHVDVSIQECVVMALENAAQLFDLEQKVRGRHGMDQRYAGSGVFPCQDGHVYVFAGGMAAARFWGNLVQWLADEGAAGAQELREPRWTEPGYENTDAAKQDFARIFGGFARNRAMADLYHAAQSRRIPLCPVNAPADVARSEQLLARGFFVDARHAPSGRQVRMPGAPYRLSLTPWRLQGPAPQLGADNEAVFARVGISPGDLRHLQARGVV